MKSIIGTTSWKREKYLQACRILDVINNKANFCGIRKESGLTTCNGAFCKKKGLCCGTCSHLGREGCTVQSISCKLSMCYHGTNPSGMELVKNNEQKRLSNRFDSVVELIKEFFRSNNIPIHKLRASMEQQFSMNEDRGYDRNLAMTTDDLSDRCLELSEIVRAAKDKKDGTGILLEGHINTTIWGRKVKSIHYDYNIGLLVRPVDVDASIDFSEVQNKERWDFIEEVYNYMFK